MFKLVCCRVFSSKHQNVNEFIQQLSSLQCEFAIFNSFQQGFLIVNYALNKYAYR